MYKLLLLMFYFFTLNAYELAENYEYVNQTVYSNDLVPDIPKKFEILQIPADKTQYRIDAQVISKTFELNGFTLDISKIRYVNFTRHSPVDFTPIKQQLTDLLREKYPSIRIDGITVTPRGYLASLGKETRGVFDARFHQNANGTFYILDRDGLRHYLDYAVNASLDVLHTNQKVSRKENLNHSNTQIQTIPFQSFRDIPLTALPDHPSRFRSSLKASQLLTVRNIEEIPLVLKNAQIIVEVKNESVIVEFGATATQEGLLYDIITIQKSDGKRAKAKVIGENRVELQ